VKNQNDCSPPAGATKVRDGNGTDGRSQALDAVLRKRRNLAQRVFSKLKQLSAIAARFDEPASRHRSGLPLASLHGSVATTSQTQAMDARTERLLSPPATRTYSAISPLATRAVSHAASRSLVAAVARDLPLGDQP
jgi:hypothetical protein